MPNYKPRILTALLDAAGLRSGARTMGPHAALMRLRHPWFNPIIESEMRLAKFRSDEDILDWIDDRYIPWFSLVAYSRTRESLADQAGADINSRDVKHIEVLREFIRKFLEDRIFVLGLRSKRLRKEYIKTLNDNWQEAMSSRRDNDPLSSGRRVAFDHWLSKPFWEYEEFLALLVRIEPKHFDIEAVELSVPYSILGQRILRLAKKVDDARASRELKFPNAPLKLLGWASKNSIQLPEPLASALRGGDAKIKVGPAEAGVGRLRDAIETAARSQNLELIRKYVQDLVDDTVGDGRLNDNRFHKEIWQPLPKNLKRQNGKPDADWHERWDAAKGDLLKKLKLVHKGLLASDKVSAQTQRR